jgi:hypothetical protein
MGEILDTPQGVGVAELRLKNDGASQLFYQTTLPGNAKLGGKIAVHAGDDLNIDIHVNPSLSEKQM